MMTKKQTIARSSSRKFAWGIMILACMAAVGCGPTTAAPPPPPEIEYVGRVIDRETEAPIPNATVSLYLQGVPPFVYTDSQGIYRFNVSVNSNLNGQIKVEAEGYQTYTLNIVIKADHSIEDIRLIKLLLTSTPPGPGSSAFTLEPTSTFTFTPPATSTPPDLSLRDGCIFSKTWRVHSSDSSVLNSISIKPDSCYDMGPIGIFAGNPGNLQILDRNKAYLLTSGIDTPIESNSVIEFKVFVNSMYFPGIDEGPLFVTFAVASAADPLSFTNTARFKLQVDRTDEKPPIVFVLADTRENNGAAILGQHYGYGNTYTIRLELTGNVMNVYINNIKMYETPSIPAGPKVFYIGYRLPVHSQIDMFVADLKIDGVLK